MWLLSAILMLAACKPTVPRQYIQPGEMEEILYDFHHAQGMAMAEVGSEERRNFDEAVYREAVFKKHGISEADFDSSMVYYCRHADKLHTIYERLSDRLGKEAQMLGSSVGQVRYGSLSSTGDTAAIWKDKISAVLVPTAPFNHMQYSLVADSTFKPGDKLVLNFTAGFLYQDGIKDGVAMFCMRLANDSVASRVIHLSSSSDYTLSLKDESRLGVKEVFGFFYLARGATSQDSETTLKIMFIDHIQLIRMHDKETPADGAQPTTQPQGAGQTPAPADTTARQEAPPPPPDTR